MASTGKSRQDLNTYKLPETRTSTVTIQATGQPQELLLPAGLWIDPESFSEGNSPGCILAAHKLSVRRDIIKFEWAEVQERLTFVSCRDCQGERWFQSSPLKFIL